MGSRQVGSLSVRRCHTRGQTAGGTVLARILPMARMRTGSLKLSHGKRDRGVVAEGLQLTPSAICDPSDMPPIGLRGTPTLERFVWRVILGLLRVSLRFKEVPVIP